MKKFEQSALLNNLPKQFFAGLVAKVNTSIEAGHDVINLGQGNPDQPTPPHIVKALQEAAGKPDYHKYSPFRGQRFLKTAITEFYQREYGVTLDPDTEVAILFGGKAGLVEIPQCLLNPGETVLVPDPGYPDYWSGVELARARMEYMPLLKENEFLPDYSKLSEKAKADAKLMFLNYPNNPTGAVASRSFFDDTVAFAEENDICVVHDFAYGAIGFDGKKPVSFLESEGAKETGIEIYTLSKTYNMAGWRIGFAVGNKSVIESINLFQDHMFVSVFSGIQEAAAAALLAPQDCVSELVARYESRRAAFIDALNGIGWKVEAPPGSFFAWLPVPGGFTSESFADYLLEHAHVCVAPGIGFGTFGEGYVRAGLLTSEERLREAAERIKSLNLFSQSVDS
ncbi:pyridoxal phosphate-dependent aminotransferase [Metabacillus indicus]|uniref:Aminotransferase n=1 Tax=Metabacillus indicus TaxID=246786 RepID=A0A084H2S3_METID|nr:pyridoxal phosphate-dependent aminotransferase [Metabacillus indicus]KEZ52673.1 aminotransferase [Metabacillus indicus LMG 22858]KEZ53885.1 aminotransferase [Metabacillus indicus]